MGLFFLTTIPDIERYTYNDMPILPPKEKDRLFTLCANITTRKILYYLNNCDSASFSELESHALNHKKDVMEKWKTSGLFSYHLRKLINHYLIKKDRSRYYLTWKGKMIIEPIQKLEKLSELSIATYKPEEVLVVVK